MSHFNLSFDILSDAKNDNVTHRKREIQSVMESIDSIGEVFSEDVGIENVFKFPKDEFENQKVIPNKENSLMASFEEIEKMDAILKSKITEEKKAKLSRIQAEEESRNVLSELLGFEMSSDIKINFEEFMKILNEMEKPEKVSDPLDELGEDDLSLDNEKKEKADSERHIQMLSEEEEEEEEEEERQEESKNEKEKFKKKELNRLKEINELLNSMNSVHDEKVNPLTVEQMESLIEQSEQNLNLQELCKTEKKEWPNGKPPQEVIAGLVSNAKSLMPKFQFRFDEV